MIKISFRNINSVLEILIKWGLRSRFYCYLKQGELKYGSHGICKACGVNKTTECITNWEGLLALSCMGLIIKFCEIVTEKIGSETLKE